MTAVPDTVVKTLEDFINLALQQRASDVHFESGEDFFRVRFRIDGLLHIIATPPLDLRAPLISRLKVQARMDIAEKRIPQDGRIRYPYLNQTIDLRVSSLPTIHGEKIVVRILNFTRARVSLIELGYEADQQKVLIEALQRPHGLLLMTGPTGSGKTKSLYSCLDLLNRSEVNITTVEDPAEIHLSGANQVNVNQKAGVTFANTLRALLRQDPDIIMVGEIRDLETAEIAVQAAQTGHLVLSTLHTNDAPGTLARLRHMGVAAFGVAASMRLVTAQRLVRRLCEACKSPVLEESKTRLLSHLTDNDRVALRIKLNSSSKVIYQAVGCESCKKGYQGRIGLFQVMPISDAMQALILGDSDAHALAAQAAREGVLTLRQSGWLKVLQGITSVDEVIAATHHG